MLKQFFFIFSKTVPYNQKMYSFMFSFIFFLIYSHIFNVVNLLFLPWLSFSASETQELKNKAKSMFKYKVVFYEC